METTQEPRWLDYVPVDDLAEMIDERNAKGHDLDELRASMDRFGYTAPIEVDERTGRLAAGHGRVELLVASQGAGFDPPEGITVDDEGRWRAPVVRGWSSKDDAEAEAYLIASNRIVEAGGWLPDRLAESLGRIAATDLGLDGVGYTDAELARLTREIGALDAEAPEAFPSFDGDLPTTHKCPRCSYEFS